MLKLETGEWVAVESRFGEPYRHPGADSLLPYQYSRRRYWRDRRLARSQELADSLLARWTYVDVAQLLKHLLGLACHDPAVNSPDTDVAPEAEGLPISLLYLWYDTGLPDSMAHGQEVERFAKEVHGDPIKFRACSYQGVLARLRERRVQPKDDWLAYMSKRYFQLPSER